MITEALIAPRVSALVETGISEADARETAIAEALLAEDDGEETASSEINF